MIMDVDHSFRPIRAGFGTSNSAGNLGLPGACEVCKPESCASAHLYIPPHLTFLPPCVARSKRSVDISDAVATCCCYEYLRPTDAQVTLFSPTHRAPTSRLAAHTTGGSKSLQCNLSHPNRSPLVASFTPQTRRCRASPATFDCIALRLQHYLILYTIHDIISSSIPSFDTQLARLLRRPRKRCTKPCARRIPPHSLQRSSAPSPQNSTFFRRLGSLFVSPLGPHRIAAHCSTCELRTRPQTLTTHTRPSTLS